MFCQTSSAIRSSPVSLFHHKKAQTKSRFRLQGLCSFFDLIEAIVNR